MSRLSRGFSSVHRLSARPDPNAVIPEQLTTSRPSKESDNTVKIVTQSPRHKVPAVEEPGKPGSVATASRRGAGSRGAGRCWALRPCASCTPVPQHLLAQSGCYGQGAAGLCRGREPAARLLSRAARAPGLLLPAPGCAGSSVAEKCWFSTPLLLLPLLPICSSVCV